MLIKESTFDLTSDSVLGSKTNHCDGACDFLTKEASVDSVKYFNDLVPKADHVYLLVVAMTAGEHYGCFTEGNDFISAEGEVKDVSAVQRRDRVVSHDNSINITNRPLTKEYTGNFTTVTARCIPDIKSTQDHRFRIVRKKEIKCKRDKYKRCTPKTMQNSNMCGRGKGCNVQHLAYTHEWVEAKNIEKGDFLVIPRKRMTKKEQKTIDPFSYDFARIFGYFLAEGSFGRSKGRVNSVRFSFHSDEIDYRDELSHIFDRIGVGYTITKQTEKTGKSIDIIATSTWLAKIVEKHCGSGCENIKMSPRLFLQREEFMLRMIGAYINGDGHSSSIDGRTTFCTTSRKLLMQLKQILFSFGIPTSYHWNNNPKQRHITVSPYGQAAFNLEDSIKLKPYCDKISRNAFVAKGKTDSKVIVLPNYVLVPVSKVETAIKSETKMVYNANIERVHSYQVNFVSVKNSNRNGDYFKNDDLIKYHKIFESAGVFWNHDNKDKSKSSGVVTKSFWNDVMHRIELVIEMPQEKARYIPQHIEDGIPIRVSMGLTTPCLIGTTKVLMSDGSEKNIKDVKVGESVISSIGRSKIVLSTSKTPHQTILNKVLTDDGRTLLCTPLHKLHVLDLYSLGYEPDDTTREEVEDLLLSYTEEELIGHRVWVEAMKLDASRYVITHQYTDETGFFSLIEQNDVVSVEDIEDYDGYVYDIVVEDDHSFVANEINVHNSESCSICGHVTRGSYANRCDHLKYMMNTVLHDGKKVYAISGTPYKIFDISIISGRQADKVAFSMLTKTAADKGGLSGL